MSDDQKHDNSKLSEKSSSTQFSRRDVARGGLSLGSLMLVTGLLDACKQRGFNSKVKDSGSGTSFLARWKGLESVGLEPRALAFQRQLLALQTLKAAPQPLFAELRAAGYKTLYCGAVDPTLPPLKTNGLAIIMDYEGVTKALADVTNFTVEKNRKEMEFATGRFVLCDTGASTDASYSKRGQASANVNIPTAELLKRHDIEKGILHQAVPADDARLDDLLAKSIKPGDVGILKNVVIRHADALGAALKGKKEIDVVQDMARWLPIRVVADYFGVPSGDRAVKGALTPEEQTALYGPGKGSNVIAPTEAEMYQWIAESFQNLFLNLTDDAGTRKRGRRAGQLLSCYVGKVVASRKAAIKTSADVKNTMVDRMVWLQKENAGKGNEIDKMLSEVIASPAGAEYKRDAAGNILFDPTGRKMSALQDTCYTDWQPPQYEPYQTAGWGMNCVVDAGDRRLTANIIGAVAGAGVTVEEVIANVFDVLTDPANASVLAYARKAAASPDYFPKLHTVFKECMRFRPQAEVVVRMLTSELTLPSIGTETVTLKAGTMVLLAITSAMRDATVQPDGTLIENPDSIVTYEEIQAKPGLRKPEHYLDMGWGRHECLGKYIAPVEVVEAMRVLLNLGDLERVDPAGLLNSDDKAKGDGPYAQSLRLRVK